MEQLPIPMSTMPMKEDAHTVSIERLVYGGNGLGRIGGKVVFVPYTIPGEAVEVKILRSKKRYSEATAVNVIEPSAWRTSPVCPFFGSCGGCDWQYIAYPGQLRFKEEVFKETLAKMARVPDADILPILPSPLAFGYRNRLRLHVKNGRVGLFARHSHDVVEVQECAVAHALINRILEEIRSTLPQSSWRGLKGIEITVPYDGNQGIVIWHAAEEGFAGRTPFEPPEMAGVKASVVWGPDCTPESAPPHEEPLTLVMPAAAGIRYYLYPGVFSQVNPLQNNNLIARVTEWAGLSAEDDVLDLFCGMGNLTLPLAREAGTVLGIEQHPLSVDNAVFNAAANRINNVTFLAQPVSVGLDNLIRDKKRFDVVVVDPPRSGCSEIVGRLARLGCSRLLYVSCDPATLSRDACLLKTEGLDLLRSQPIDMFPQTYHIESLTLFGKRTT